MKFPAYWKNRHVLLGVYIKNRLWKIPKSPQKCIKSHRNQFCRGVGHFQHTSVGKTVGATLHRDHRGSAACRCCLLSPQAALGSFSWRFSASLHAWLPCIPSASRCRCKVRGWRAWWEWACPGHAAAEPYLPAGDKGTGVFSGCDGCRWMEGKHPKMGEMNSTEGMGMCRQSWVQGEAWGGIVFCLAEVWIQDREHSKAGIFLNDIEVNFPRFLGGF